MLASRRYAHRLRRRHATPVTAPTLGSTTAPWSPATTDDGAATTTTTAGDDEPADDPDRRRRRRRRRARRRAGDDRRGPRRARGSSALELARHARRAGRRQRSPTPATRPREGPNALRRRRRRRAPADGPRRHRPGRRRGALDRPAGAPRLRDIDAAAAAFEVHAQSLGCGTTAHGTTFGEPVDVDEVVGADAAAEVAGP